MIIVNHIEEVEKIIWFDIDLSDWDNMRGGVDYRPGSPWNIGECVNRRVPRKRGTDQSEPKKTI
jgi:hypothetical protein